MTVVEYLRRGKLWTRGELARRSGVSERTIDALENLEHTPQMRTIRRVSDALGLDWGDRDRLFRRRKRRTSLVLLGDGSV